jgi:antitoxin component YwqK of YwqJK toxin-antitoxin module
MAEVQLFWRRCTKTQAIISAVGLSVLLFAGCSRSGESLGNQANADVPDGKATKSSSNSSPKVADAEAEANKVISDLAGSTAPPRKVAGHKELVVLWDDPSKPSTDKDDIKPRRLSRVVKIYSDGGVENDGRYTEWYLNGKKMEEGDYVDGVRQGKWNLWHENGKLRRTENFLNGKLEGTWKQFRDDGTLESEQSYKNNLRDGKWVAYDSTGKRIDAQCDYKAGVFDGVWTYYYDEDNAKKLVDAEKLTKEQSAALVEKRQKRVEQHFKDGQPDGDMTSWFPNGKIESIKHYKNGRLEGEEIVYKESGEILRRRHWSGGQLIGTEGPPSN